jgi:hypothetical protein
MAKMTMTQSEGKFDVPEGDYLAKFLGIDDTKKPHPEYGPGLEWQFEIVDHAVLAGKIATRSTAIEPTTKNSCGVLLRAVATGGVTTGQEVDLEPYVGKVYQIGVRKKENGKGTRVETVTVPLKRVADSSKTPATGPPPRKLPAATAAPQPPVPRYWVIKEEGTEAVLMTDDEVRLFLKTFDRHAANVPCVLEGETEWKNAQDYGFNLPF